MPLTTSTSILLLSIRTILPTGYREGKGEAYRGKKKKREEPEADYNVYVLIDPSSLPSPRPRRALAEEGEEGIRKGKKRKGSSKDNTGLIPSFLLFLELWGKQHYFDPRERRGEEEKEKE